MPLHRLFITQRKLKGHWAYGVISVLTGVEFMIVCCHGRVRAGGRVVVKLEGSLATGVQHKGEFI